MRRPRLLADDGGALGLEDPDLLIEPWVQVERRIARGGDQARQLTGAGGTATMAHAP